MVRISGGMEVRFSRADGALSIWQDEGSEALVADLKPCFYRAPTDNDRGGSGGSSYSSRCVPGAGAASEPRYFPTCMLTQSSHNVQRVPAGGERRAWTAWLWNRAAAG